MIPTSSQNSEILEIAFFFVAIFPNFAVLRARRYHRREKRELQSMSDLKESFWDALGAEIEEVRPDFQGLRKSSPRA